MFANLALSLTSFINVLHFFWNPFRADCFPSETKSGLLLYLLLASFHSDQTFYYLSSSFSTAMSDVLGCLIIIAIESRVRRNLGNEEEGAEGGRSRRGIHGFGFLEVVAFVLIWKGQVMSLTGANAWPARIIARHSRSRGVSTIDTIVTTFLGRIIDINSLF